MHCLVTGATGYLGQALAAALLVAGCEVTAHSRQRDLPPALRSRVRSLKGDLATQGGQPELRDVDVVFHLAAIAHHRATPGDYRRHNLDMPLALARAAASGGVRRFVFISSVKAAAAVTGDAPAVGETAFGPDTPLDYARSKALAEARLRTLADGTGMSLVVVRPALIYGDDAPGHLALLRRWVNWRLPAPPAGGARSMVSRDDLVRLCVRLLDMKAGDPPRLTVTDGEAYTTRRLHAALCRAAQRTPLLPSPPGGVWRLAANTLDVLRGSASDTTWIRLTGSELSVPEGLDDFGFVPRLTFERSLGLTP